jgi:phage terminase large subunit-like protein
MARMSRGERVCAFIETYCKVPEGELVGKPMRLEPFQRQFICSIYDNPYPEGTRRAILSTARKNGKTGLIAAILLAHLVGPEARLNSQIISGAQSRDQAALVYGLASKMVRLSPEISGLIRIVPSSKRLIGLTRNVEYHAISAEGKTAHGLSPHLALLDEVGQVRGGQDDFVDAILTSQGAHADPLLITISTQAPNDGDLLSQWIDDARGSKDPRIVCHVYEAPADCDLDDRSAWEASNPAMGKFRSLADLAEQAERAQRLPGFEPTFRNLGLNQRVEIFSPFVSKGTWVLNSQEPDYSAFYDSPVWVGLDLSGKSDLTAAVVVAQKERMFHVKPVFWTPEKGLKERARLARAPFDQWAKDGHIRVVPGASIDYEIVAKDLIEILADCDVRGIAFDRWRIDLFKKELKEAGGGDLPMFEFGQGFKDMGPAVENLEEALLNERILHGNHPVLTMCAMSARVEKDAAGNRKFSKAKATNRIDGIVALAMALGIAAKPVETKEYQLIFV